MKKLIVLFFLLLPLLHGCGESDERLEKEELAPDTCHGFGAPSINIEVKDSLNEELIIDTAYVTVHIEGESNSILEAEYTPEDDNNFDSQQYAYWTLFEVNSIEFEYGIVVSAPNYHPFVTKNIQLTVDTSCGADNRVSYELYLCPLGSSCL